MRARSLAAMTPARAPLSQYHSPGSTVAAGPPPPTRIYVTAIADEADELALVDRIAQRRIGLQNLVADFAADDECEHGRVPGDHTDACGCFTPGRERPYPGKKLAPGHC